MSCSHTDTVCHSYALFRPYPADSERRSSGREAAVRNESTYRRNPVVPTIRKFVFPLSYSNLHHLHEVSDCNRKSFTIYECTFVELSFESQKN